MKINSKMNEANISSEEFTQRMANLEKKLQQITAERDLLKEENKVHTHLNMENCGVPGGNKALDQLTLKADSYYVN